MGLIEVIRGLATADETVKIVETYAAALGKRVVHANDAPGFIVNRVLMPMLNEACFALGEGVATRSEEHTSELQSLMRISYAVFCLKKKKNSIYTIQTTINKKTI